MDLFLLFLPVNNIMDGKREYFQETFARMIHTRDKSRYAAATMHDLDLKWPVFFLEDTENDFSHYLEL